MSSLTVHEARRCEFCLASMDFGDERLSGKRATVKFHRCFEDDSVREFLDMCWFYKGKLFITKAF